MELARALEILQMGNVWLVMGGIALYQLYLQFGRPAGRGFVEGWPKLLQIAAGIPALVVLALFMCDPDIPAPHITSYVNAAGVAIFDAAALMIVWCHLTLGRYWSGDLETQPDHRLVDTGPYALVRHPLYSSYFVLCLGLLAMSGSWLLGIFALAYFAAVATRIPKEEAMLAERLGESYRTYSRTTGCVLPRLWPERAAPAATD